MKRYLSRRVAALHALGLASVAVCLVAANWQWSRAHVVRPSDYRTVDFAAASPLRDFLPVGSIAATTTVSGTWVPGWRMVLDRPADGRQLVTPVQPGPSCPWLVDALLLADDSVVAVVRGCGSAPAAVGSAQVTGMLQPSEDSGLIPFVYGGPAITTQGLVAALAKTTHDGYLVEQPAAAGLTSVTPIVDRPVSVPLHWRNVVYVFNWLIFAVIISLMWAKVVRDEIDATDRRM